MNAATNTCANCHFWKQSGDRKLGACRIKPPVPIFIGDTVETWWPMTNADDWCGRFFKRKY